MSNFIPTPAAADPGIFGLGVIGANLARGLTRHGHAAAAFNRTLTRIERLVGHYDSEGDSVPAADLKDFMTLLYTPRVAIVMVQAGAATEVVIGKLTALIEPDGIIVDAGNTLYTDTRRRGVSLRGHEPYFAGMGVSGDKEGAFNDLSIMPGGAAESYDRPGPVLESISAHVDGTPYRTHVSPDGAGHLVKMVHNGVEYTDMRLIAEAYDLLRHVGGFTVPETAEVFRSWKGSELDSHLIDITTEILSHTNTATGEAFVDVVVDATGQKGTGVQTTQTVLELGVVVPAIAEAIFAYAVSFSSATRTATQAIDITVGTTQTALTDPEERHGFADAVKQALYGSKIVAYTQGFGEITTASKQFDWNTDPGAMAHIWRGGCIIHARFLDDITCAYAENPSLASPLTAPVLVSSLMKVLPIWRQIVATSTTTGVLAPASASSLAYVDQLRSQRLPAVLIQGWRDPFGSHTYRRTDGVEGIYHTLWTTPERAGEKWD